MKLMSIDAFDAELRQRFPTVIHNVHDVDCPAGWQSLVLDLLAKLEDHAKTNNQVLRVEQVKEKYGGLRCYLSESDEHAERMIAEAEAKSVHLCQVCGEAGKREVRGRLMMETVCPLHRS